MHKWFDFVIFLNDLAIPCLNLNQPSNSKTNSHSSVKCRKGQILMQVQNEVLKKGLVLWQVRIIFIILLDPVIMQSRAYYMVSYT